MLDFKNRQKGPYHSDETLSYDPLSIKFKFIRLWSFSLRLRPPINNPPARSDVPAIKSIPTCVSLWPVSGSEDLECFGKSEDFTSPT